MQSLTSPRCGAILIAGADNTSNSGRTAPSRRLFHALLFLGQMSHTARMAACLFACYQHLPHPLPVIRRLVDFPDSNRSMDMSTSISTVAFHGANLALLNRDGKAYVAIKPICEALTLNWVGQLQRIKRNPVLAQGMCVIHIPSNGGMQEMTCLPLSMLNGWLFGINANRVKNPVIRQKLIEYQFECYDALNAYWTGKSVQPQADLNDLVITDAVHTLIDRARYLVGFWHQYGPAIRMLNSNIADGVYDCFWDADWSSGLLARKLGIPIKSREYFQNYPFDKDSFEKHQYYLAHSKNKGN